MLQEGLTCAIAPATWASRPRKWPSRYNVSRADQDAFAAESQQRAVRAIGEGRFKEEIVPVSVPQRKGDPVIVDTDEYPRAGTTAETLAALKPAFKKDGSVTAGNASGINDGAAALVVTTTKKAQAIGREAAGAHPVVCLDRRRSEDHGHGTGPGRAQGARARRPEDRATSISSS